MTEPKTLMPWRGCRTCWPARGQQVRRWCILPTRGRPAACSTGTRRAALAALADRFAIVVPVAALPD
ncbi:MAG: hypothetical protein RIB84_21610 [Sneathiellaceae bacterium]